MTPFERFQQGMALNHLALDMKRRGVVIDLEARKRHATRLDDAIRDSAERFRLAIDDPVFELPYSDPDSWDDPLVLDPKLLGSVRKLEQVFFGRFRLHPISYSHETGKPKLDETALKAIIGDPTVLPRPKAARTGPS